MPTIPDVFIIESLDPDDEGNGRFEGSILSSMLRLHGKQPKYRYVRTRKQFLEAVDQFGESQYRYLHISAHADEEGMATTNQEEIDFDELAGILRPHLAGRRLFLSACSMVHQDLAAEIIPKTGCYSVVGPYAHMLLGVPQLRHRFCQCEVTSNPSIERTSQRPLRAHCAGPSPVE